MCLARTQFADCPVFAGPGPGRNEMTVKSRLSLRGIVAAGAIMLGLGAAGAEPIRIGIVEKLFFS